MSINCNTFGSINCPYGGIPQELCEYSNCTFELTCTSEVTGCTCPTPYGGLASSILPPYLEEPRDVTTLTAIPIILWSLPVLTIVLRSLPGSIFGWKESSFPLFLIMSRRTFVCWITMCIIATSLLLSLTTLPPDIWGSCSVRGTCVYHQMFCEATNYNSAIRHPANFWSNLPYTFVSLGLLCMAIEDKFRKRTRPYQLLDAIFSVLLLSLSVASFLWHGSNCTVVHFIDIGLMNAVIAFFPFRSCVSLTATFFKTSDRKLSTPAAIAYTAISIAIIQNFISKTNRYHEAIPTGRALAAASSLTSVHIAIYAGAPGLYPIPTIALMFARKRWGYVPALYTALIFVPFAFTAHAVERLVLDLWCDLTSVFQPTAIFHVMSALGIASAYVQCRSIDNE